MGRELDEDLWDGDEEPYYADDGGLGPTREEAQEAMADDVMALLAKVNDLEAANVKLEARLGAFPEHTRTKLMQFCQDQGELDLAGRVEHVVDAYASALETIARLRIERDRKHAELCAIYGALDMDNSAAEGPDFDCYADGHADAGVPGQIEKMKEKLEIQLVGADHNAWKAIDDDDWCGATFANYLSRFQKGQRVTLLRPSWAEDTLVQRMREAFENAGCFVRVEQGA
jgi:hypothetical protein